MTPNEEQRYEQRFDRIEGKLDRLVEIVSSLARVEEQMANNNKRMDNIERRVEKNERDINNVAEVARSNSTVARFADKFFWVVLTAAIGVIVYWITH